MGGAGAIPVVAPHLFICLVPFNPNNPWVHDPRVLEVTLVPPKIVLNLASGNLRRFQDATKFGTFQQQLKSLVFELFDAYKTRSNWWKSQNNLINVSQQGPDILYEAFFINGYADSLYLFKELFWYDLCYGTDYAKNHIAHGFAVGGALFKKNITARSTTSGSIYFKRNG